MRRMLARSTFRSDDVTLDCPSTSVQLKILSNYASLPETRDTMPACVGNA